MWSSPRRLSLKGSVAVPWVGDEEDALQRNTISITYPSRASMPSTNGDRRSVSNNNTRTTQGQLAHSPPDASPLQSDLQADRSHLQLRMHMIRMRRPADRSLRVCKWGRAWGNTIHRVSALRASFQCWRSVSRVLTRWPSKVETVMSRVKGKTT